jgi:hypothetical protein
MSCGIILVLSFGPKLQLNLKNMDMRCEVRIQRLWTVCKNYGQKWVGYACHLLTCTQLKHCLLEGV